MQHGEQWSENACTTCICDRGEVRCHKQACLPLRCGKVFESVYLTCLSSILDHLRNALLIPRGIKSCIMFAKLHKDMRALLPRKKG